MPRQYYLHRTLCDVLDEMRQCWKTRNFGPIKSLIEEAQMMGNRMEAAIGELHDIEEIDKKFLAMRQEYKELQDKINLAKSQLKLEGIE